ncbi:MAG: 3-methyl-2-oxobutanoate hydroxymethyltransferase [Methylothermaceae bacteria B42]|nr:MAG: 3-methyl-2-oxobutanoate hydroxymethyltransferase [Methylothermaceae bacteria B42]HHJ38272.1 3-methyl-2-oxobutanoate hydroxymethyltransferase [Methylothermaceae bacterium]
MTMSKFLTVADLKQLKQTGEKIACLTAYDATFAKTLDAAGVDILLVGDSLGMVIQGQSTTLPVTLDYMVYHTACVNRGRERALLIADLPFMTCWSPEAALQSAARLIQQGGAEMVKLEGGRHRRDAIRLLVQEGIPVCGHLGLLPQSIHRLGGYKVQGVAPHDAEKLLEEACLLEEAGAELLVLECIPATLARAITMEITIPTIGIGAGPDCDGQVLVLYDMLGLTIGKPPRFVKDFLAGAGDINSAVSAYVAAVKSGQFPSPQHSY